MTFNSFSYFLFLPVVYLVFYLTADRWRWLVLLAASYGFYAFFKASYLLAVLFMVTSISYACGLRIGASQDEAIRKRWLWVGSFSCVAVLAAMKYLPFLQADTHSFTLPTTLITIGVSYFTFQAISYLADVYLEVEEGPERHFGHFALYMAFFPKLLQGPIERAGDLLPQLKKPYQFDYDAMRFGMLLFTWGFFKKVVVADRLALYADQVYNHVHDFTGLSLVIGTYAYALQIYFDFSAYTDMARGTAQIFGVNLTQNFDGPYLSTSIAEFWRRWHISFSRWILDYIFKPLQMGWRRWGQAGTALALIITFLVSGIWHGATWGFVVWGLLHGIYLASSTYYRPYQKRLHKWLGAEKKNWLKWWQIFVTFNLVSFAWVFFRAGNLNDAWYVISNFCHGITLSPAGLLMSQGKINICVTATTLVFYLLITVKFLNKATFQDFCNTSPLIRYCIYNALLVSILLFAQYSSQKTFVYFQF